MKHLKVMFSDVNHGTLMRLPYFGYNVLLVVVASAIMLLYMSMMGFGMDMGMMLEGHMMLYFLFMLVMYYFGFVLAVKRFRDMGMMHEKLMGFLFVFLGYMAHIFDRGMPMMMERMPMMHDMVMKLHLEMVFSLVSLVLFLMLLFVPSGYMKK